VAKEEETSVQRVVARMAQGLQGVLIVLSAVAMIAFLRVALKRLHFAYEYDWIEARASRSTARPASTSRRICIRQFTCISLRCWAS